ncbi:unnamed protein product [Miscanthus lutarioriparius]|uniref:SAP domain-containing protein n=1 Tax=Miscanthus lutarioriparius TaxID=422564 RepID=A0A811MY74_9POAL|nr:unnamed protein product [Miscanthus lutarioriparius]
MAAAATDTPTPAGGDPRPGHLSRSQEDRRKEEEGSDESEEEEVESDDGEESDVDSLAGLCDLDAGSDEDPTFDPGADGDLEVEAVLRARMSRMSISASARKGRKGSAVPKMGKEETDLLAMVDKLMQDGQLEKLKVYECKAYLRMHKLRLTSKKEVLLNRIREHIEVKNDGEVKYPVSSFVLNCKGDACKGDVVMFEQNIYKRMKDNKIKKQWNVNQKQPQEPQQKVESTNNVKQRVNGRKGPSFQNGEPGNTRQQHVSSKATSTHHNELLPQKGSARTFKPELIDYQVSSIQYGGMQQKLLSNPTHTQQLFKNSSPHQSFQQEDDALTQEGAIRTSRKAFIDHHVLPNTIKDQGTQAITKYLQSPLQFSSHDRSPNIKARMKRMV